MAQTWTLTGDTADMVGGGDLESLVAFVVCSETGVTDSDTGQLRLGSWKIDIPAGQTTWSVAELPSSADAAWLPGGHQFQVRAKFWDAVRQEVVVYTSRWFDLTANMDLSAIPPGAPVQISQETYESVIAARDETVTARDVAVAAAEQAQAPTDGQVEISLANRGLPVSGADLSASTEALLDTYVLDGGAP